MLRTGIRPPRGWGRNTGEAGQQQRTWRPAPPVNRVIERGHVIALLLYPGSSLTQGVLFNAIMVTLANTVPSQV